MSAAEAKADQVKPPKAAEEVPFNYHSRSPLVYAEKTHNYNLEGWIDLTASDGILAMQCIRDDKPYLGICYTDAQREGLNKFLLSQIWTAFQDPEDSLHQPGLRALLEKVGHLSGAQLRR